MPRIRFLADVIVETEGFQRGERIAAGEVREVSEASANRWLRRKAADLVPEPAPARRRAAAPVEAPAPVAPAPLFTPETGD